MAPVGVVDHREDLQEDHQGGGGGDPGDGFSRGQVPIFGEPVPAARPQSVGALRLEAPGQVCWWATTRSACVAEGSEPVDAAHGLPAGQVD